MSLLPSHIRHIDEYGSSSLLTLVTPPTDTQTLTRAMLIAASERAAELLEYISATSAALRSLTRCVEASLSILLQPPTQHSTISGEASDGGGVNASSVLEDSDMLLLPLRLSERIFCSASAVCAGSPSMMQTVLIALQKRLLAATTLDPSLAHHHSHITSITDPTTTPSSSSGWWIALADIWTAMVFARALLRDACGVSTKDKESLLTWITGATFRSLESLDCLHHSSIALGENHSTLLQSPHVHVFFQQSR